MTSVESNIERIGMPGGAHGEVGEKGELVAFQILYEGPGTYAKEFEGAGYGLVLDDDGESCYLYAATEDFQEVLDGLHLYNQDSPGRLDPGEKIYIIWNPVLAKAGLYYHGFFQAIVDFANSAACCRTGQPQPEPSGWCRSQHHWDPKMQRGLTFNRV